MLSVRKILQALYYIQSQTRSNQFSTSRMYLLKMMYFADRYHLRHFGIIASDDDYFAMRFGPVASATYDILKQKFPEKANSAEMSLITKNIVEIDENNVIINEQQTDELSESYIEALDFSIKQFGKFSAKELSKISHNYPEWKNHQNEIESNPCTRYSMEVKDFFSNIESNSSLIQSGIQSDPFLEDADFLALMRDECDSTACSTSSNR